METGLKKMECGSCGCQEHNIYQRPNGEILTECTKCNSVSAITVCAPKIQIRNASGDGTLCVID